MASEAAICNLALLRVGQRVLIDSLDDETEAAQVAAATYPLVRDDLLAGFDWPWARRFAQLAALSGVTRPGWSYGYALPADFLEARDVSQGAIVGFDSTLGPPNMPRLPYVVEASDAADRRILFANISTGSLVYTARIANAQLYPPAFVQALAWALAVDFSISLPSKPELAARLAPIAAASLQKAQADAGNASYPGAPRVSEFIAARE